MYILTHKQSKGSSFIIEYERNRLSKTLAVNSFKYRMIKGGREGGLAKRSLSITRGGGGVQRGPKCDHAILEQPLIDLRFMKSHINLLMIFMA